MPPKRVLGHSEVSPECGTHLTVGEAQAEVWRGPRLELAAGRWLA
ncbi:hypothetical protein ACIPPN_28950 [Streptomyces diastaticus]|nr:hypothetical protein [Streptomyces diastaticus]